MKFYSKPEIEIVMFTSQEAITEDPLEPKESWGGIPTAI